MTKRLRHWLFLSLAGVTAAAAAEDLRVVTSPPEALVLVDGVRLGVSRADGIGASVDPGEHIIKAELPGYAPAVRTIRIEAGAPLTIVRLELVKATPRVEATPEESTVAAPEKKGGGTTKALLIGGGVAVAGLGIALASGGEDPLEVDDDRDGFSEKAGDCNDADAQVRPNGPVTFNMIPGVTGTVNCRQTVGPLEIRGTNLSCTPVTLSSLVYQRTAVSGGCIVGGTSPTIPLSTSALSPGARDTVVGVRQNGFQAGCCFSGFCGSFSTSCGFQEVVAIVTDRGTTQLSNSWTVQFPAGFSCTTCSSSNAEIDTERCPPSETDRTR